VSPKPQDRDWLTAQGMCHVETSQHLDPLESARKLLAYCGAQGIDGVINNDNPVVQSIAPGLRVPMLAVCHMDRYAIGRLCTLHSDWIDHLICISSDMQRNMVASYRFPVTRCAVVHNGLIDPGHDGHYAQRDPSTLRLVYCGGWSRLKGGQRVLDGLLQARDVWHGIHVDWFGDVPNSAKRRARKVPCIEFHGQVPRETLREKMAAADALLFASTREGCPMTIIEALSLGVLPISSDGIGAMRWLLDSGREGFICRLRDWPVEMAACIRHLCAHPGEVEAMKRASRRRFLTSFQGQTNALAMLELLAQPTIDRSRQPERFDVVAWHRVHPPAGRRNPLSVRHAYRMGRLSVVGQLGPGH
jgi:glycosyltransferase involved in cell wall biosynthesis